MEKKEQRGVSEAGGEEVIEMVARVGEQKLWLWSGN
jgi:hypothetical protein